jgi:acyl carrier protein
MAVAPVASALMAASPMAAAPMAASPMAAAPAPAPVASAASPAPVAVGPAPAAGSEVLVPELVEAGAGSGANPFEGVDVEQMLLETVADKTGYPIEILNMGMSLESDLGIDSIKRVEILSAIQDRFPNLPEVDASEVAALQTLGDVKAFMEKYREGLSDQGVVLEAGSIDAAVAAPAALPAPPATTAEIVAQRMKGGTGAPAGDLASSASVQKFLDADLQDMLFDVVADKTGYPKEILNTEMALESDLGIDSIKRVEILSAIQDEVPDLPEVDAAEMAQLQTLGQVLDYMETVRGHIKAGTLDDWLAQRTATSQTPAAAAPEADAGAGSSEAGRRERVHLATAGDVHARAS